MADFVAKVAEEIDLSGGDDYSNVGDGPLLPLAPVGATAMTPWY